MYTESDFLEVKKQLKKMLLLTVILLLAFIVPAIAFMLRMPQWIGATFLTAGICIAIFLWGVFGTPIYHYYHFLKDIFEGRTREMKGRVTKVEEEPVYKDNRLLYYQVWMIDDEDGEERILLFDDNKGKPSVQEEKHYSFRIHESFITQITEA
jgi:hypothetical protein